MYLLTVDKVVSCTYTDVSYTDTLGARRKCQKPKTPEGRDRHARHIASVATTRGKGVGDALSLQIRNERTA